MVNGPRKNFFSRSAFTQQQHGRFRGRHPLGNLARVFHRRMFAQNARKSVAHRIFFAQQQIFPQQFLLLRGAIQQQFQVIEIDRFLDEIEGAFFHCGDRFFHRAIRGHQNYRQSRLDLARFAQHIQA